MLIVYVRLAYDQQVKTTRESQQANPDIFFVLLIVHNVDSFFYVTKNQVAVAVICLQRERESERVDSIH